VCGFVREDVFSAQDHDIYLYFRTLGGANLGFAVIDLSAGDWRKPRVASLRFHTQFLVVAEMGGIGWREIAGRTVESEDPMLVGPELLISSSPGEATNPDVSGDASSVSSLGNYAVVWANAASVTDHNIHYRYVHFDSQMGVLDDHDRRIDIRHRRACDLELRNIDDGTGHRLGAPDRSRSRHLRSSDHHGWFVARRRLPDPDHQRDHSAPGRIGGDRRDDGQELLRCGV
jgi:hypothetical protein